MSTDTISTFFFDIGGVLLDVDIDGVIGALSSVSGVPRESVHHTLDGAAYDQLERGQLSFGEYYDSIRRKLSLPGEFSLSMFEDLWEHVLTRETPVAGILPELKAAYGVWLLSNTSSYHGEILRQRYSFMADVHGIVASFHVGSRKPEAAIYRYALQRAGARPERSIFIDDREVNVRAAAALGFHAHHYQSLSKLKEFLSLYGITPGSAG